MNTPQPMSDAEMRRLLQQTAESIDALNIVMTHWPLVARAILAARDAQWVAMLGEPVAWEVKQGARTFLTPAAEFKRMSFDAASFSPLYAIKETP